MSYFLYVCNTDQVTDRYTKAKFCTNAWSLLKECIEKIYNKVYRDISYDLGVNIHYINEVIRNGCPRNQGFCLQEVGHAGRKLDSTANGMLLFNECVDDKCLGQWLKASSLTDPKFEAVKQRYCSHIPKLGGIFIPITMESAYHEY